MNTSWEHLRNRILLLYSSDLWKRTAFFIFISYTVLSLSTIKLIKKEYYLLYPFAFLSVFPFWLIESRYSLTAIILFMLFRKSGNRKLEYLILAIFAVFSLIFFKGYLNRDFYLWKEETVRFKKMPHRENWKIIKGSLLKPAFWAKERKLVKIISVFGLRLLERGYVFARYREVIRGNLHPAGKWLHPEPSGRISV